MIASITASTRRLKVLVANPLTKGATAFGGAELANRAVRLVTTVVIARQLAPDIVGEAALTLTLFEILRVFAGIGIGQRIIACEADKLAPTCNSAHRLFWIGSAFMVLAQVGVAVLLGLVFGFAGAAWMLVVLSLVYPMMPGGLVQVHLAMREGLNGRLAKTAATQAIADHLLTAALLLAWPSPWSLVLPKLLTAPVWLIMSRRNRPWQVDPAAGYAPMRDLLRFGGGVLASDSLNALRGQGDNLIIAVMMGTSALGAYYFAFNAGLGIVTALVGAFATVSFPMLCAKEAGDAEIALRRVLKVAGLIFVPMVACQALLAPLYVPLIFGQHWAFAAPLIAILCLAGLAHLASSLTANWLRSQGRVAHDAGRSLITCIAALGGLYIGALSGELIWAITGLVAGQSAVAFLHTFHILRPAIALNDPATTAKEQFA